MIIITNFHMELTKRYVHDDPSTLSLPLHLFYAWEFWEEMLVEHRGKGRPRTEDGIAFVTGKPRATEVIRPLTTAPVGAIAHSRQLRYTTTSCFALDTPFIYSLFSFLTDDKPPPQLQIERVAMGSMTLASSLYRLSFFTS
jgi:hypothetical protein